MNVYELRFTANWDTPTGDVPLNRMQEMLTHRSQSLPGLRWRSDTSSVRNTFRTFVRWANGSLETLPSQQGILAHAHLTAVLYFVPTEFPLEIPGRFALHWAKRTLSFASRSICQCQIQLDDRGRRIKSCCWKTCRQKIRNVRSVYTLGWVFFSVIMQKRSVSFTIRYILIMQGIGLVLSVILSTNVTAAAVYWFLLNWQCSRLKQRVSHFVMAT